MLFSVTYFGAKKALELYQEHIEKNLKHKLGSLSNKTLGCYCTGPNCHGIALIEVWKKFYATKDEEETLNTPPEIKTEIQIIES